MTGRDRDRIDRLLAALERARLEEYLEYAGNVRRGLWRSLLYGVARGFGFTLGFSVLGALLVALLRALLARNIPMLGGFLAQVVRAMEAKL